MNPETVELLLAEGIRSHSGGRHLPRYKAGEAGTSQQFRVERARYARTEDGFRRWAQGHLHALYNGDVGVTQFYKEFSEELYRYHVRMYVLGRRAAGLYGNTLDESERRMLHGLHAQEMKFFSGFMRDYVSGGGKMPLNQRIDLYALGGYEVYLRGVVKASGFAKFTWHVNPDAEHCEDCIYREKVSRESGGFTIADLDGWVGYPGQKTKCRHRCRCHLKPVLTPGQRQVRIPRTRPTSYKALVSKPIGKWKERRNVKTQKADHRKAARKADR